MEFFCVRFVHGVDVRKAQSRLHLGFIGILETEEINVLLKRATGRLGALLTARRHDGDEVVAVYVADDHFPDVLTVKFAPVPSFVIRVFSPEAFLVVARAALGFCAGLLTLFVLYHVPIHDVGAPLVIPRIRRLEDGLEPGLAWKVEALGLTSHNVLQLVGYKAGPWQAGSVLVLTAAGVATEKTRL